VRIEVATALLMLLACVAGAPVPAQAQNRPPGNAAVDHQAAYRFTAAMLGLDPNLLEAIASVESGGDASAVSPKGAKGVMQLMPGTARRFGVRDPFNPVQNIFGAGLFLSWLKWWQLGRPQSPADLVDVLAAYNAGPSAVQKYGGVPPYPETEGYVRKVLILYLFGVVLPARGRLSKADSGGSKRTAVRTIASQKQAIPKTDPIEQLCEIRSWRARVEQGIQSTTGTTSPQR
jgi:soluble lytic murein transglycosylase-like protein